MTQSFLPEQRACILRVPLSLVVSGYVLATQLIFVYQGACFTNVLRVPENDLAKA